MRVAGEEMPLAKAAKDAKEKGGRVLSANRHEKNRIRGMVGLLA